eukprot:4013606-Amphidinium_carterae.1
MVYTRRRDCQLEPVIATLVNGQSFKTHLEAKAASLRQALVDGCVTNNILAQHVLVAVDGTIAGGLKKSLDVMGVVPAQFFDPSVTPTSSPSYVNTKNLTSNGVHSSASALAQAVNCEQNQLNVRGWVSSGHLWPQRVGQSG